MGGLVVMKASYGQRGCRASAEKMFQGELNFLLSVGVYTTKWILGAFMDLATSNWQCRRALVNHPNKSLAGGCSSWCSSGFVLQKASVMSDVSYELQLKSFLGHFPHSSGILHTQPALTAHPWPEAEVSSFGSSPFSWAGSQKHHF